MAGPVVEAWLAADCSGHRRQRLDRHHLAGMYGAYTQSPIAVPFNMSASYAGWKTSRSTPTTKAMRLTSTLLLRVLLGERRGRELHRRRSAGRLLGLSRRDPRQLLLQRVPARTGTYDSDVDLAYKTSATLVENKHRGADPRRHHDGVGRGRQRDRLQLHEAVRRRRTQLS